MKQIKIPQERVSLVRRDCCRSCGSPIEQFLDFGFMPLAGAFLSLDDAGVEKLYPMTVCFCSTCTLVQIPEVISKETLFNDNYRYLSSVTETLNAHFRGYANYLVELTKCFTNPTVLEFGCNDGILLEKLESRGVRAIGVDASSNVAAIARGRGLDVIAAFFNEQLANRLLDEGRARPHVITGSNVFAHNDDVGAILTGVKRLLDPDGYFIVEVHSLTDLLDDMQFDFFYHEHCNYYSLHSLVHLLRLHGFAVVDVEHLPMHGGALRVIARHGETAGPTASSVGAMLRDEEAKGLTSSETYRKFAGRVLEWRDEMAALLTQLRREGKTICGYGASGRAVTLLNFLDLGTTVVDFMLDASHSRMNTLMPGIHVPILEPTQETLGRADICLITAWPYAREIMHKESWFAQSGGTFIVPLPTVALGAATEA